jgi:hypothetical protein
VRRALAAGSINAGWTLALDPRWSGFLKNVLHHIGVRTEGDAERGNER